jgi:hypothetical protein
LINILCHIIYCRINLQNYYYLTIIWGMDSKKGRIFIKYVFEKKGF